MVLLFAISFQDQDLCRVRSNMLGVGGRIRLTSQCISKLQNRSEFGARSSGHKAEDGCGLVCPSDHIYGVGCKTLCDQTVLSGCRMVRNPEVVVLQIRARLHEVVDV